MRTPSVLACLALVGATTLVASPASAAPLVCGATVTVSTTLTTNLTCPASSAPALTLGAGVTLNLGGHAVRGPGSGIGIGVPQDGDVVIRNGTLKGWGIGIDSLGPVDEPKTGTVTVDRVRFTDGGTGVDASGELPFSGGKATYVSRSTFDGLGTGIDAFWFADVWVTASSFTHTTTALRVDTSSAEVTRSRFAYNGTAISLTEAGVTVTDSVLDHNDVGFQHFFMGAASAEGSTFRDNGIAIDARSFVPQLDLTGNTFARNTSAVLLADVEGTIDGNTFRGNGTAVRGDGPVSLTNGLVVTDNVLRRNGDALFFEGADANTSLGGNTAVRNTGWGIYAPGVTDLGGNTAHHNGNSPQCVGVVCS